MRNLQAKFVSFVKKHKILSVFLTLIFVLCLWWVWTAFAPHPFGNKMEYLGKEDFGNILGFDYQPYSVYYYGTDMSIGEIEKYFKDVTIDDSSQQASNETIIVFTHDKKTFEIDYYWDKSKTSFTTNKKNVVSVVDEDYKVAKEALK